MQHFVVHPENPQRRLIKKAVELLQKDVIAYPTDSYYAFGCLQRNTEAIDKIRRLRQVDASHLFTLSCRDIRQVGDYAVINNAAFRLLRQHAPGAYTFILTATKKVPKHLHHPRRKTVAFRVPKHSTAAMLLEEAGEPIITTTLKFANEKEPTAYEYLSEKLKGKVAAWVDAGPCPMVPTTILDFTETPPRLLRQGGGHVEQ